MKQSTHFYEAFACRDNGEEFSLGIYPKLLMAKRAILSDECHSSAHDLKKTTYNIERIDVLKGDLEKITDEDAKEAMTRLLFCGYSEKLIAEFIHDDDFNEIRCQREHIVFSRRAHYEL